ncbi:hypothetical protein [Candidatus Nanohalobium constans]|uniref:Uncharacterized protein n=1 Tax=Candidatus Nanohalobium constans TaxID=2565781 RepID=A0A5Q0UGE5_9ARCH|nr:hypothetical protein [Candidatus Nanohalobium constans]QGA80677.1 hypothetical protein LC1Nh_0793 [Candidatus Nanohalobium constans]
MSLHREKIGRFLEESEYLKENAKNSGCIEKEEFNENSRRVYEALEDIHDSYQELGIDELDEERTKFAYWAYEKAFELLSEAESEANEEEEFKMPWNQ